jgi:RluA family pseudouridine synthase
MAPSKKKITLTCTVDAYRSGWTLAAFLDHRFPYHAPEAWRYRIVSGQVLVNGAPVEPGSAVRKGDEIRYTIFHAEPDVDFGYDVLYEDDSILAVSKSGNIPVHACGVYITHTLIARIRDDFGPELNLVHRLDRETSGCVLMSKTGEAARTLSRLFRDGAVTKTYLAVVYGHVPHERFTVDAPIGAVDKRTDRMRYDETFRAVGEARYLPKRAVDFTNGKPARTVFTRRSFAESFTVLEAHPLSGRTNQIRVHLAHAGHPVVGDKLYALGGDLQEELVAEGLTSRVREALVTDRHALHCSRLELHHPLTGARLCLEAPAPEDMRRFL